MLVSISHIKKSTLVFLLLFLLNLAFVNAQTDPSPQDKTLVVYNFKNKGNEKQSLIELHNKLTSLGVDVVNYVDSLNLKVSLEVELKLFKYIQSREIKNILFYNETKQEINLVKVSSFISKKPLPYKTIKGDSVLNKFKHTLSIKPRTQKTFLYSPQPEVIEKVTINPFNKILLKPNLKNQKIGVTSQFNLDQSFGLVLVEAREDYRFYYSNGINYFIGFLKGTESFLKKTYSIDGLKPNSNKEILVLVLEHTATRNKLFYFNKKTTSKKNLLDDFLSN